MSTPPPPIIDAARLVKYAVLDESVRYTGRSVLIVGGVELGPTPRLAICENLAAPGILLLHCSSEWQSLGASGGDSLAEVEASAERAYEGVAHLWVSSPYSEKEVAQFLEANWGESRCNFCGKWPWQTDGAVQSKGACICKVCVIRLYEAFQVGAPDGGA